MSMYARCVRRAVVSLNERPCTRLPQALRRRCLATAEPTHTAVENAPPSSFAEATSSSASWNPTSASTAQNVDSIDLLDSITTSGDLTEVESSVKLVAKTPDLDEKVHRGIAPSCGIHITPVSKLLNMPSIFALVREIEKQYGSIREFRILRDKDSPSNYLKALFINFNNPQSVRKLQEAFHGERSGTIMVGSLPAWNRAKELEGGVGLADIQQYLRPADVQNEAVVGLSEEDKQMEKDVDNVKETMKSSETQTEETMSTPVSTPASFNICECRVYILEHDFAMKPILHLRPLLFGRRSDRRTHLSRAFIHWGGFYPHYRFAPTTHEEDEFVIDGKVVTDANDVSEEERKRFVEIRDATRAMRDSLVRVRLRLRDIGDPDHGLEKRNGVNVVLDWEKERTTEASHAADSLHEEEIVTDEQTRPFSIGAHEGRVVKTKRDKPRNLTPEEEEGVERILQRARARRQPHQGAVVASSKSPTLSETEAVRETTTSATSSSSSRPQDQIPSASTARSQTQSPQTPTSVGASPSQESSVVQEAEAKLAEAEAARESDAAKDVLNNRERRARRKALEEEEKARAGFKAKLLGWLGR